MKTVNFNINVQLIKDEMSPEEKQPQLNVFLDARFKRKPITIGLNAQNVEITGQLPIDVEEIPQTATLCLSGFAWRKNNFGDECLMDVGTTHIPIGMITNGQKTFDLPLLMHTVNNYEKAKLEISVNSFNMDDVKVVSRKYITSEMMQYINATIKTEERMPDTISSTANMRVPYDYSESGFEMTKGTPLPAFAYVMGETPESNTLCWKNTFKIVMKRDDMEPSDFKRLSKVGKARVMALMMCCLTQYLEYIGDTIDKNTKRKKYLASRVVGCENFGSGLVTFSGDCEDLGTSIMMVYNSFIAHKFDSNEKTLIEIQQLATQYIPLLSLDAVNGAQVADKNAPKGAHINLNMVPIHQFRSWMRKTPEGKQLDNRLSSLYPKNIDSELLYMVGEGTGKLEPLGVHNPNTDLMGYVYGLRSLRKFKKPIPRKQGEAGSFLVGSLTGMTDYFIKRGVNIGSLWYTTVENGKVSRGAYYRDMINDHPNVGIKMHEPVSKNNMDVIREAILTRDPPHDMVLTNEYDYKYEKNEHLDHIVNEIENLDRTPGELHRYVPIYVRPYQIDVDLSSKMAYQLSGLKRVWKVDYALERITDEVFGYELRIYVN